MSKFVLLANDFSAKIQIYASEEDSFTRKMKKKIMVWFFPYGISNNGLTFPYRSLLIHYDWGPVTFRRWIITIYIHFRFRIITVGFFFCQITTAPICPFRFHEKSWIFFFILNINCGKSSILFFCHCIRKIDSHPLGNNKHNITYCM